MCSALFSVFLTLFPIRFIIFVESLSSIISLWFSLTVSSSLEKHPFSSLSLFLSSHICLSEFSCISLSYFITAVLNSLSFKSQSSWLSLLSGDFLLSFCTAVLPWYPWFLMNCVSAWTFEIVNSSLVYHVGLDNSIDWLVEVVLLFPLTFATCASGIMVQWPGFGCRNCCQATGVQVTSVLRHHHHGGWTRWVVGNWACELWALPPCY